MPLSETLQRLEAIAKAQPSSSSLDEFDRLMGSLNSAHWNVPAKDHSRAARLITYRLGRGVPALLATLYYASFSNLASHIDWSKAAPVDTRLFIDYFLGMSDFLYRPTTLQDLSSCENGVRAILTSPASILQVTLSNLLSSDRPMAVRYCTLRVLSQNRLPLQLSPAVRSRIVSRLRQLVHENTDPRFPDLPSLANAIIRKF